MGAGPTQSLMGPCDRTIRRLPMWLDGLKRCFALPPCS
jgi:hypothetical protein